MVIYRGQKYYVISTTGYGNIEIAPTKHGAGSIIVHEKFVQFI